VSYVNKIIYVILKINLGMQIFIIFIILLVGQLQYRFYNVVIHFGR